MSHKNINRNGVSKEFLPDHWKEQIRKFAERHAPDDVAKAKAIYQEGLDLVNDCCTDMAQRIFKDMGENACLELEANIKESLSNEDRQEFAAEMTRALIENGASPEQAEEIIGEMLGVRGN